MNESWEQKLIKTFEKEKNKEIKVSENFNCRSNKCSAQSELGLFYKS